MSYTERVRRSIDFIEQNLSEEITLDRLARLAYFSKYHFHRLFKSEIGKTLMEYVRERRLIRAAHELAYSSKTIGRIAFDLNFNSQDGFDKAFKNRYGISPKEYRKNVISRLTRPDLKERVTMNNFDSYQKIVCSNEEKKECLPWLDRIIALSQKAHRQGLLSLESELTETAPFLFQKGLRLMLGGTEPIVLREILNNYIYTSNLSSQEFLAAILIKKGLLSIQMGEYPWEIREKLISWLGIDFAGEVEHHFGTDCQNEELKIKNFIAAIKTKKTPFETSDMLDKTLAKLDHRSLQRALRDIDIVELAVGMKGAGGQTKLKIVQALPRNLVLNLIEADDLFSPAEITTPQIVDAQNSIVTKIKKLKAEGEIR